MVDSAQDKRRGVQRMSLTKYMPSFMRGWRWQSVTNLLLLLIALSIIGQTWYLHEADEAGRRETARVDTERQADSKRADADNADTSRCLRDSVVGLTDALQSRLAPAEVERQAVRALILGALSDPTPEEGLALVAAYKRALRLADQLREDTPVPDYPDGLCENPSPSPSP